MGRTTPQMPLLLTGSQTLLKVGSLGPPESSSETASRTIRSFLYSSRQSVPMLYSGPPQNPHGKVYWINIGSTLDRIPAVFCFGRQIPFTDRDMIGRHAIILSLHKSQTDSGANLHASTHTHVWVNSFLTALSYLMSYK